MDSRVANIIFFIYNNLKLLQREKIMNTKQLEYFISLAETLNFTKTAQKFYISQTAISKQIMALERTLDTKLFNRNNHYVELTPAGNVFLSQAKAILYKIDEATEKVHLTTIGFVGLLRIGFVNGYEKTSFSELIFQLYNQYPNISITFFRGTEEELNRKLKNSELDIIFNVANKKEMDEREVFFIKKYPFNVVVHPTHPFATRKVVKLKELEGEKIYKYDECQDVESILLMVSANMGIAILPSYCIRYFNQSQYLMIIPLESKRKCVNIVAMWNAENQNPALLKFINIIKDIGNTTWTSLK